MNYAIKIESPECDPIEIGNPEDTENQNWITEIDVHIDTIDNDVRQKASGMLARVTIRGNFDDAIHDQLIELFNWSKELSGDKWYRDLEIKAFDGGTIKRTYVFPKMFVVDYKEFCRNSGNDTKDTFELCLTQKENNFKGIKTY